MKTLREVAGDLLKFKPFFEDYQKMERKDLADVTKIVIDGVQVGELKGKEGMPDMEGSYLAYRILKDDGAPGDGFKTWFGGKQILEMCEGLIARDVEFPIGGAVIKRRKSKKFDQDVYFIDSDEIQTKLEEF